MGFGSSDELVAAVVVAALVSTELGLWLSESLESLLDVVSLLLPLLSCCYHWSELLSWQDFPRNQSQ